MRQYFNNATRHREKADVQISIRVVLLGRLRCVLHTLASFTVAFTGRVPAQRRLDDG